MPRGTQNQTVPERSKPKKTSIAKEVVIKKVRAEGHEVQVVPGSEDELDDSVSEEVAKTVKKKSLTKKVTETVSTVKEVLPSSSSQNEQQKSNLGEEALASMKRLLNENTKGTSAAASIQDAATENFHFLLLHRNSDFNQTLRKLLNERILWCDPLIPTPKTRRPVPVERKLKVASWNTGQTKKTLIYASLAILMKILKMDIILVQEIKELKFEDLYGYGEYHIICLPADSSTDTLKRGLFILYRSDLFRSLSNPSGIVGHRATKADGSVTKEYMDIEVSSIDAQNGKDCHWKIINLYRTGNSNAYTAAHLHAVLQPLLEDNMLLLGDANMFNRLSELTKKLVKNKMKNHLPKKWDTHFQAKLEKSKSTTKKRKTIISYTQPDIICSNICQKDLIVHKPVDPRDLVEKFKNSNIASSTIVEKVQSLCGQYDKDSESQEHHYILFVEMGNEINSGNMYHCCPPRKGNTSQTAGKETTDPSETNSNSVGTSSEKYSCSDEGNDCKFFENAISQ